MLLEDLTPEQRKLVESVINTPHYGNFNESVKIEMMHHHLRWGDESDLQPHNFQMVISRLNGKLIEAIWSKDIKKYEHHLITIAAVAGTCHKYLKEGSNGQQVWFNGQEAS